MLVTDHLTLRKGVDPKGASVSSQAIFELCHAMRGALRDGEVSPDATTCDPDFAKLVETCARQYPQPGPRSGFDFAVKTACGNLGIGVKPMSASDLVFSATQLDAAFRQREAKRVHLCPLDYADELPKAKFGPNSLRSYSADDLADLLDPHRVARRRKGWQNNIERLSRFSWLVVDETIEVPSDVAARALPELSFTVGRDFGAIVPHKSKFPACVQDAIFALLLVPWEDYVHYVDVDWRAFRLPWVHTITDDIFTREPQLRDADTLSWEPDFNRDHEGNEIEDERPVRLPIEDRVSGISAILNDDLWSLSTLARGSHFARRPFVHFFVRAFQEDEIDEFLAHITVIEATLGNRGDFDRDGRPKFGKKNPGATDRVKWRVGGLLGDDAAGKTYGQLFERRSDFLHGREMADISSAERVNARKLARHCVFALLSEARNSNATVAYDDFLHSLLLRGRQLGLAVL